MGQTSFKKKNLTALVLLLVALAAVCLCFALPTYEMTATVYTKKSPNTFVNDEKYMAALEEVQAVEEEYRNDGFVVERNEDILERTNSKGQTTSLITFTLTNTFRMSTWDFLGGGLNSSKVLLVITIFMGLCAACALAGTITSMDVQTRDLDRKSSAFRTAAMWFALAAAVLIPVFVMMNTYTLSRQINLYTSELLTEGRDEFYALMNRFLFDGMVSENGIEAALKGFTFANKYTVWIGLVCLLVAAVAAIDLRYGAIKKTVLKVLLYVFVIVVCVITLYPYYVMLVTGFRSYAETNDMHFMNIFPVKWIWSNFTDILNRGVPQYLLNSLLISSGATLIAMLCGIPAAYAMARMRFKGKNIFLGFVIMSQMFAPVVLLIGIYQLMSTIGMNDSIWGLMLINAAFNQAFAIWLLRGTFVSISPEMEQAALIDGCNTGQSLIKVLLPMAAPGIVTALIFVFINAWNEYTISTVLITTAANKPITVGLTTFSSFNMIEWQYLFAASLLATIPVVILFMCIEEHLTSGLTAGGVKG